MSAGVVFGIFSLTLFIFLFALLFPLFCFLLKDELGLRVLARFGVMVSGTITIIADVIVVCVYIIVHYVL